MRILREKKCFEAWIQFAVKQQEMRAVQRLLHLQKLCLSEVFGAWKNYSKRVHRTRALLLSSMNG